MKGLIMFDAQDDESYMVWHEVDEAFNDKDGDYTLVISPSYKMMWEVSVLEIKEGKCRTVKLGEGRSILAALKEARTKVSVE